MTQVSSTALQPGGVQGGSSPDIEEIGDVPVAGDLGPRLARLASIALVLVAWEVLGRRMPLYTSYPSAIVSAAGEMIASGQLWKAMADSARTLFGGFFVAAVVSIGLGLLVGRYRFVRAALDWMFNAIYATPLVAVIPLVIIWMGLGFQAKLFIVALFAFFPILINTIAGVRNVSAELIEVADAFSAKERQIFLKVILPSAVPYIMTGLRLGIGRALIGMIFAEFFTAITGLGGLIKHFERDFDTASMFVPILVLTIIGVLLIQGVRLLENRVAPWQVTARDD
jgi:NitT/TauT family transport system permease protein